MSVPLRARLRRYLGPEIRTASFWKAVAGEFIASALFIIMACGVSFEWFAPANSHFALSTGLGVAMLAHMFWEVSGGQFNPAVAVATALHKRISWIRCVFYIIAQILGCLTGSRILYSLTPSKLRKNFARLQLQVTPTQGFFLEFIITLHLIWTILAVTEPSRPYPGFLAPLAIGLAVTVGLYIGIPYTGGAMNPLRAFGPAFVEKHWENHWVYWVAPILSAVFTAALYKCLAITKEEGKQVVEEKEEQAEIPLTSLEAEDVNANE